MTSAALFPIIKLQLFMLAVKMTVSFKIKKESFYSPFETPENKPFSKMFFSKMFQGAKCKLKRQMNLKHKRFYIFLHLKNCFWKL